MDEGVVGDRNPDPLIPTSNGSQAMDSSQLAASR